MKFKRVVCLGVGLTLVSGLAAPVSATDNIVVSIKPIHSLVASVTKGVSEPFLILQRQTSPHTYSLRPSEARKLHNAKVVFWIGEEFENFLVKPLKTLGRRAQIVTLSKTEQLTRHKFRKAVQFKSRNAKTKKHNHGQPPRKYRSTFLARPSQRHSVLSRNRNHAEEHRPCKYADLYIKCQPAPRAPQDIAKKDRGQINAPAPKDAFMFFTMLINISKTVSAYPRRAPSYSTRIFR